MTLLSHVCNNRMRKMPPPFLDRYSHILKSVKKKQKEYDEFDISGFAGC